MLPVLAQPIRLACTLGLLCSALLTGQIGLAQTRPLPDVDTFLAETRSRLDRDEDRQAGYVYLQTERREILDGSGRVREEKVRILESYPGLPGEGRWERVIEEQGRKVPDDELRRLDAERQRQVEAFARRVAQQSDADKRAAAAERAKRRREGRERVDEVLQLFDFRILSRESIEGRDTIVLSFDPRPNSSPKTREGKWLRHFKGRAWINEADHELVRLEAQALHDVTVGFGFLARIHEGTTATFTRRKVNNERWLPASASYSLSGRMLLFKRLHERGTMEYSNYRRFDVEAASVSVSVADAGTNEGATTTR
jgi:hypothetical protein